MYLAAQTRTTYPPARWHRARRVRPRTIGHYRGLAAISPDDAAQTAMPKSEIRDTAGFRQADYDNIVQAASSGQFAAFNPQGCTGVSLAKPIITSTIGGLSLKFAPMAFAGGPVVGGIVLAVGAISSLFGAIFGHHARAVAAERKVVCAAVPSANDALYAIDQAVQAGTFSPQQGQQALDALLAQFKDTVKPILKMSSDHCNAACIWVKQLTAIVAEKKSQYADLLAPAPGAAAGGASNAAASGGIGNVPPWLWLAAAALVLWELV